MDHMEETGMIAIIFEVYPAEGKKQDYLDYATALRAEVEKITGFISVERFESLTTPGKMLSISVFEDETALSAWRNTEAHRTAQLAGRTSMFADYRLRVAHVIRNYGMNLRDEAPEDSRVANG